MRTEVRNFIESADEIARGGMDLSARTESQASSLEETAAAMEQLASTVLQTSETAAKVSHESAQSSDIATRGGQAVQEVGAAMQQMKLSSTKISEIVGVIEGIAFQTTCWRSMPLWKPRGQASRAVAQVVAGEVRALGAAQCQLGKGDQRPDWRHGEPDRQRRASRWTMRAPPSRASCTPWSA